MYLGFGGGPLISIILPDTGLQGVVERPLSTSVTVFPVALGMGSISHPRDRDPCGFDGQVRVESSPRSASWCSQLPQVQWLSCDHNELRFMPMQAEYLSGEIRSGLPATDRLRHLLLRVVFISVAL